jgi:hypothetical protein
VSLLDLASGARCVLEVREILEAPETLLDAPGRAVSAARNAGKGAKHA